MARKQRIKEFQQCITALAKAELAWKCIFESRDSTSPECGIRVNNCASRATVRMTVSHVLRLSSHINSIACAPRVENSIGLCNQSHENGKNNKGECCHDVGGTARLLFTSPCHTKFYVEASSH